MCNISLLLPPHGVNTVKSLRFVSGFKIRHDYGPPPRPNVPTEVNENHRAEWAKVWQVISSMRSLQTLRVNLRPVNATGDFTQMEGPEIALDPVEKREERGRSFSLTLPIPSSPYWNVMVARAALAAMEGIYTIDDEQRSSY